MLQNAKEVGYKNRCSGGPHMELEVFNHGARPRVSVILLDWTVRESFHSPEYLNRQTVPRGDYELIWIEFYGRRPQTIAKKVAEYSDRGAVYLDKWIRLGFSPDTYYHKHFMYNIGIALAAGEICVICDSDVIYGERFIETIVEAFNHEENIVLHIDQVRTENRAYWPFNNPTIEQILADGHCINWRNGTTAGLINIEDRLHAANYGACMAARRADLIEIGGADEHIDYLGHVCGPYEMTFRLCNLGRRELWHPSEFTYHTWHPGTDGRKNYGGPHDGRLVSLRALEARQTGRIRPLKENIVIRSLRRGEHINSEAALEARLAKDSFDSWREPEKHLSEVEAPMLVQQGVRGFNVVLHNGIYHAIHQNAGAFDPEKIAKQAYDQLFSADSLNDLIRQIEDSSSLPGENGGLLPIEELAEAIKLPKHGPPAWRRLRRLIENMVMPVSWQR